MTASSSYWTKRSPRFSSSLSSSSNTILDIRLDIRGESGSP
jgi:hypothetical protein